MRSPTSTAPVTGRSPTPMTSWTARRAPTSGVGVSRTRRCPISRVEGKPHRRVAHPIHYPTYQYKSRTTKTSRPALSPTRERKLERAQSRDNSCRDVWVWTVAQTLYKNYTKDESDIEK